VLQDPGALDNRLSHGAICTRATLVGVFATALSIVRIRINVIAARCSILLARYDNTQPFT